MPPALPATAPRRIKTSELPVEPVRLARFLIGKLVMRRLPEGLAGGRIVETEAYVAGDAAGHGFNGPTPRNKSLFGPPGHAYVYIAYGTSMMLNVSSSAVGIGHGVLIRALEPVVGIGLMEQNRGTLKLRDLARGPGRLTQALDIDLRFDGIDLCGPGDLWLATDGATAPKIGRSVRIGLTKEAHRPLRFFARGNPFVSGPKSLNV